jgi:hypothetical protein
MAQRPIRVGDPLSIHREPSPAFYSENTFKIDDPDRALNWLQQITSTNTKHLTKLSVFVHAVYSPGVLGWGSIPASSIFSNGPPCGPKWRTLFDKLAAEAVGLQELDIFWDAEPTCWHFGGGADVDVVQALAQIKGLDKLEIGGYFAKEWPIYLKKKMGLKVWDPQGQEDWYLGELERFQRSIVDSMSSKS